MDNIENKDEKLFSLGRLDVVDLYEWFTTGKIVYETYFQRQYVWRNKDKVDLIDTIMKGYPIPSIFINDADTNLTSIKKKYNVLDGRQRLESIFGYINGDFQYQGKKFEQLPDSDKRKILNYNISLVQMYVDPNNTIAIKEIFKRLNKNSYTLNAIEKQSTQLVEYDFMVISKIAVGIIQFQNIDNYVEEIKSLFQEDLIDGEKDEELTLTEDINNTASELNERIKDICEINNITNIQSLYTNKYVFSQYENQRQVNLQHFMNIYFAILKGEIFNRNVTEKNIIEASSLDDSILKSKLIEYNNICKYLIELYENEELNVFWKNKTSLYTLSVALSKTPKILNKRPKDIVAILNNFSSSDTDNWKIYKLISTEAVNDKNSRLERNSIITKVFEHI